MDGILESTVGSVATSNARTTADDQLQWVIASQQGDRAAFNRLVLLWQQRIYNLSLRLLRDPEEASEATQETFLSAFRAIRRFRLEAQFSTWLYRIASNQCMTRLRKHKAQPTRSIDEDEGTLMRNLTSDDDHEEDYFRRQRQLEVRRFLAALPEDQRVAVELKFYQELTFEEIAVVVEAPLSTVKSRFYAGLHGLKRRLEPQAC